MVKNLSARQETPVQTLSWGWLPTPVFLPGDVHGQQSLGGLQFMECKVFDGTEGLILLLFTCN